MKAQAEDTPARSFGCDVAKEALHHVQPRSWDRCEVHIEPGVFVQPLLPRQVLVRGDVAGNQVQGPVLGRLLIGLLKKLQLLDVWHCWRCRGKRLESASSKPISPPYTEEPALR